MNQSLNYWLERLENVQAINLPGGTQSTGEKTYELTLSREETEKLQELSKGKEFNLLKLSLCALSIVISKYTRQQQILFSIPPIMKTHPESNGRVYCYFNEFGNQTVEEFLRVIHGVYTEALHHSEYDNDLFLQRYKSLYGNSKNLRGIGLKYKDFTSEADLDDTAELIFELIPGEQLSIRITQSNQLFPTEFLESLVRYFHHTIANLSQLKNTALNHCAIFSQDEMESWSEQFPIRNYDLNSTVLSLFLEQVKERGDHTAIDQSGRVISYKELNAASDRLAAIIQPNLADSNQQYVALWLENSIDYVISVLAVLKTGAAIIPLDKKYPTQRILDILSETKTTAIITNEQLPDFDHLLQFFPQQKEFIENAVQIKGCRPHDDAYVIYSSGTTGKPKGIRMHHSAILNLLLWYNERYGLNADSRIIQLTKPVIDIGFQEIFSALINGATLFIPDKEILENKDLLQTYLRANKISFIQLIPDTLEEYFAESDKFVDLQVLLVGGDKLSESLKEKIVAKGYTLYNVYGQTETAIDVVAALCKPGEIMKFCDYVPNYDVWILDETMHLCPEFVTGEIAVGGVGLSNGYVNQSELTQNRFVAHPYYPGRKIYKTGDMGRRLPDGSIQFIGRDDQQVKILGFRIELEEIELAMEQLEQVEQAVVVVAEETEQLIGFYTSSESLMESNIRDFIALKLPAHMIPTKLIQLDKFPLTGNGKVDRKVLRTSLIGVQSETEDFVEPTTDLEHRLLKIWEDVLGRTNVSVTNNFFKLGGHSLKATRLIGQIHKNLGVRIGLRDVFEYPTIRQMAAYLTQQSTFLYTEINASPEQECYPLSSSQKRLWILCQDEAVNNAYNICEAYEIRQAIDLFAFERAIDRLTDRHESLRTRFREGDDQLIMQWILLPEEGRINLEFIDLSGQGVEQCRSQINQANQTTFRLDSDALLQLKLIRLAEDHFVLSCVMHHIISDGWSMEIVFRELIAFYEAELEKKEVSLPTLRIQYKDYAVWEQNMLTNNRFQQYGSFWKETLEGELPLIELPLDRNYPAKRSYQGEYLNFYVESATLSPFYQFLQRNDSSLFMGLLALVKTTLHKYSGQEDLIIGTPVAGREHPDFEQLIGLFLNTVPIRTQLTSTDSFLEVLSKVRVNSLSAFENQMYPLDLIINDLQLVRDNSRNALFDVVVVLQNTELSDNETEQQHREVAYYGSVSHTSSKFDLVFNFSEQADALQLGVEYNKDIFDRETVVSLTQHCLRLLELVATDPSQEIGSYPLVDDREKQEILAFNGPKALFPDKLTIVNRFEQIVDSFPDKVALSYNEGEFTYAELNLQVNQLANYLQEQHQVAPGELVVVNLPRSEKMIIALLAILKAGGVYVPVDPTYPEDRINYILSDSRSRIIIDPTFLSKFEQEKESWSGQHPKRHIDAGQTAYVIYTSGTTGRPKGTLVTHRNVIQLMLHEPSHFDFSESDVWTMFHSYCFDFSVWEMYGALLFGGKLVIVSEETTKDFDLFAQLISDKQITVLNQTPSVFKLVSEIILSGNFPVTQLRYVIFGGEALMPLSLKDWYKKYPNVRLINMYGITETTVHVTYKEITGTEISADSRSIGKPLPMLHCYVLNERAQPVPVGASGELYVGGSGVTKGYLNRDELTGEKFITDPFHPDQKLYRSGDKVKYNRKGELVYLGRIDDQVKIRGYRIELGEIEQALLTLDTIDQALVIKRDITKERKELIAYCRGKNSEAQIIRKGLEAILPGFMIPDHILVLGSFPITSNGKIDRKKLPLPTINEDSDRLFQSPENELQTMMVEIWQQVLGINNIGILDNFFHIGGNSISTIEILSNLKRKGWKLTVKDMFTYPTIQELSAIAVPVSENTINQNLVEGSMPLLPIQKWYFEQQDQDLSHFNFAALIRIQEGFTYKMLCQLAANLVKRHDSLRLSFEGKGATFNPDWQQIVEQATEHIHLEESNQSEFALKAITLAENRQTSLNIHTGPLFKLVLISSTDVPFSGLFFCIHHLIADAVSWRILLEDIQESVAKCLEGKDPVLASKTNSYRDWYDRLNDLAGSEMLLKQRKYWQLVLSGVTEIFPGIDPDRKKLLSQQRDMSIDFSNEDTTTILRNAGKMYSTEINDLLLAALSMAVKKWNSISRFLIHLEGHGRDTEDTQLDISHTVGWFTTIYPVLLDSEEYESGNDNALSQLICKTKENLRGIPNKGIGYGILRYLSEDALIRRSEANASVPILFNYLGDIQYGQEDELEPKIWGIGNARSGNQNASYPIEINGANYNGSLKFSFSYIEGELDPADMNRLMTYFKESLLEIADHCVQSTKVKYTPSDFPLINISQDKIRNLEEKHDNIEDIYPATPTQKGIYFHTLLEANQGTYIVQQHGKLNHTDSKIFKKSWEILTQRHHVLRTVFELTETELLQVVLSEKPVRFEETNIRHLNALEQQQYINQIIYNESITDFKMDEESLLKIQLFDLDENNSYVLLSFHHIILDGWSFPILYTELLSVYSSLKQGIKVHLPPVTPYRKFVEWQQNQDSEIAINYWRSKKIQTTGIRRLTDIPENEGDKTIENLYREVPYFPDSRLLDALKKKAADSQVTLNALLLAGWAKVLKSLTQQDEVVFGITVSGRSNGITGVEKMVGLLINTIPFVCRFDGGISMDLWIRDLFQQQMESDLQAHIGLTEIRKAMEYHSSDLLFESLVVHENYPNIQQEDSDHTTTVGFENVGNKDNNDSPITLMIFSEGNLSFIINYRTDLYSRELIDLLFLKMEESLLHLSGIEANIQLQTLKKGRFYEQNS